jgi:hypothetical protein
LLLDDPHSHVEAMPKLKIYRIEAVGSLMNAVEYLWT